MLLNACWNAVKHVLKCVQTNSIIHINKVEKPLKLSIKTLFVYFVNVAKTNLRDFTRGPQACTSRVDPTQVIISASRPYKNNPLIKIETLLTNSENRRKTLFIILFRSTWISLGINIYFLIVCLVQCAPTSKPTKHSFLPSLHFLENQDQQTLTQTRCS